MKNCLNCKHCRSVWYKYRFFYLGNNISEEIRSCWAKHNEKVDYITSKIKEHNLLFREYDPPLCSDINKFGECGFYEEIEYGQ